jgi:tRNA(Arg) A34 adenosine deaminase TadA
MHDAKKYMRMAIELANNNILNGGGPFGALIVRNNEVIGTGANQVTNRNDPTAHAEILAIREASQNLNNYNLSDCTLYTTCEPCPMCLGAIYWARIPHVYFGNNRQDAAEIGFDDDFIYKEIATPIQNRSILMQPLLSEEALATFKQWAKMPYKTEY